MNVNEAIAAVKANQPHEDSPLPWSISCKFLEDANGGDVAGFGYDTDIECAHARIAAAPVLVAEVERLQAALDAARVAVAAIKPCHSPCNMGCNCDRCKSDFALLIARRALGLE